MSAGNAGYALKPAQLTLSTGAREVGVTEDLCVYCGACVLNCMVDDCIKIERTREDGKVEHFSKPKDVIKLEEKINGKKRFDRVKSIFPTIEAYCERFPAKSDATNLFSGKPADNRNTILPLRKKSRNQNRKRLIKPAQQGKVRISDRRFRI